MIKCTSCSTKNINEAGFCRKCGKKLTKEEKEKKVDGLLYRILKAWDVITHYITLEFITDHIICKILVIVVILGIGILSYLGSAVLAVILFIFHLFGLDYQIL